MKKMSKKHPPAKQKNCSAGGTKSSAKRRSVIIVRDVIVKDSIPS